MIGSELKFGFIIEARNRASKPIQRVKRDVAKLQKQVGAGGLGGALARVRGRFEGLDSTIRKFRASIFAITMGIAVLTLGFKKLYEWVDRAAKLEDMQARFREALVMRGVKNMKIFMKELHHSTKGMISDFDLIRNANFALYADLPVHLLPKYLAVARSTAKVLGRDLTATSQQILRGLVTGYSITMKRALLITKDKRQVLKAYGEENKLTKEAVNALTEAEKTGIYATYVFAGAYKTFGHIFEDFGFSDLMSQMAARTQNVKDKMGDLGKHILGPYLKAWWSFVGSLDTLLDRFKTLDKSTQKAIGMIGAMALALPIAGLAVLALAYIVASLLSPALLILGSVLAVGAILFYSWANNALRAEGRLRSFKDTVVNIGHFLSVFWRMVTSKLSDGMVGVFRHGEMWFELTKQQQGVIRGLANAFDFARVAFEGFSTGFLAAGTDFSYVLGMVSGDKMLLSDRKLESWREFGKIVGEIAAGLTRIFVMLFGIGQILSRVGAVSTEATKDVLSRVHGFVLAAGKTAFGLRGKGDWDKVTGRPSKDLQKAWGTFISPSVASRYLESMGGAPAFKPIPGEVVSKFHETGRGIESMKPTPTGTLEQIVAIRGLTTSVDQLRKKLTTGVEWRLKLIPPPGFEFMFEGPNEVDGSLIKVDIASGG